MESASAAPTASAGPGRQVHFGMILVFLILCFTQFYLAGRGIFHASSNYDLHKDVGNITLLFSLLFLIATAGIPATRNRPEIGMAAALFVLVVIQAVIGNYTHPTIAAFHPVNALLIIGLAFGIMGRDREALGWK